MLKDKRAIRLFLNINQASLLCKKSLAFNSLIINYQTVKDYSILFQPKFHCQISSKKNQMIIK
uniref:Uncharacterized protein n=1 Tax=Romanomermis culicivorax TaxID=13658 RepID=A0A915HPK9_ROMCU